METRSLTVNRSAEETAKQFQEYLRKYEKDEKLVIEKAVDKPGSQLGDNYTSIMIRTDLVGKRGNGSPYSKSFMTKMLSETRAVAGFLGLSNLFRNEAHVYHKVLPILGSFGPACIYFDEKNIIMEDLGEKGYVNRDRRNFLDLEHTICALKTLAKLHASALTVKIKNPQLFDEMAIPLKEVIYTTDDKSPMLMSFKSFIKALVQYIEMIEPRTEELKKIIDIFNTYVDTACDTFVRLFNAPKEKYHTICHGDPWTNNILYLHDNNGKIIDLKMVDYQISRHTSVASDIHYLIYTSVQSSLIEKSYESLIKIYHNTFLEQLRRSHVPEKILTELGPEWLETELQTFKVYGAITGCWLVHAILADQEDVEHFEQMELKNCEEIFDLSQISVNKKKLDRVKCITSHYYRRFCLGIINDDLEPISITG